ncbi:hypothetical protein K2173_022869 [Erythroxylum novogranatense]|uniref:Uncharacterized protein n=1 Tax=Erythroxylum novogranatense TaxID=1862640 RepID=A0AAV8TVT0_9ROSI|nr:hypothetical protein K2173_022869 [Erythroxylum novogranatense]
MDEETNDTEGEGPADLIASTSQFDPTTPLVSPPPTTSGNVFGSVASSSNTDGIQQNKGKRKMRDTKVLENVAASFLLAINSGKESARIIADAIVGLHGTRLSDELGKLGFSTEEVIKIGRIFAKDVAAANLFWDLNEEQRLVHVRSLLD